MERDSEDEEEIDCQMASHNEAGQVAELELDDHVVNPWGEAEDRVHHKHEHEFIEELGSAPARCLVHPTADDDDLRGDLASHQEDLPDEDAADCADGYPQHDSPKEEEAGHHEDCAACFQSQVTVEGSVSRYPLIPSELVEVFVELVDEDDGGED